MTPMVSVIVPVYNVELYLQACLNSLVNQTFPEIEVIMVNDGSDDASGEIMDRYDANYANFKAYHKENGGLGHARNFGLNLATGDYIAFLDSDDTVSETAYQTLVETAMQTGSDVVTGNVVRFNSSKTYRSGLHKRVFRETILNTHITKNTELIYDTTSINKIYKRSFWDQYQLKFPEGVYYEDIILTIAAHYLAASVDVVEETIYYWRSRDGGAPSITQQRNQLANLNDRLKAIRELDDFFVDHRIEGRLREEKEYRALTLDIHLYLKQLDDVDDHYLDVFMKEVGRYLKGIQQHTFQRLEAIDRLKYQLIEQGEKEKLLNVLNFQKRKMKTTKVIKKGQSYYGDYPYKEEFSEEFLRLNHELRVVRKIEQAKWEGSKLFIRGYNYVEKVDLNNRKKLSLEAFLKNPLTDEQTHIPVHPRKRADVTHKRGIKASRKIPLKRLYHYHWSGYELTIDFASEEVMQLGDGRLELWFRLAAGGVVRKFRAGGADSGKKTRPHSYINGKYKVFPHYNQADDLVLERAALTAAVNDIDVNGHEMIIKGWRSEPEEQASLLLKNRDSAFDFHFPLASVAGGTEQAAKAYNFEVPVDLGQLASNPGHRQWEGYLSCEDGLWPLTVFNNVDQSCYPHHYNEVFIEASQAGHFIMHDQPLTPSLDHMAWQGQKMKLDINMFETYFHRFDWIEAIQLSLQHVESGKSFMVTPQEISMANDTYRRFTGTIDLADDSGRGLLDIGKWQLYFEVRGEIEGQSHVEKKRVRVQNATFDPLLFSGLKLKPFRTKEGYLNIRVKLKWHRIEDGPRRQKMVQKVLYPLFRLLPISKKTIVFESYWGRSYSCNPRALYEYMDQNDMGYRYVWTFKNENTPISGKAKAVRIHSWLYYYYLATAKYFINNANFPNFYKKRKNAVDIQTLHGTPLKKMGLDVFEATDSEEKRSQFLRRCDRWDYLLSPSRYVSNLAKPCFDFQKNILEYGFPRNDMFKMANNKAVIDHIKNKLDLPHDKKIMLYAPTWRVKHTFKVELALDQMQQELGDDYILLLRLHYFTARALDLSPYEGFAYNVSSHDDMQELCLISDVLITDYSSVMFDYANLNRPILFFTYDLENYRDQLRGLYIDFEEEAPGPLARTTDQLIDAVKNIEKYEALYGGQFEAFREKYCQFDEGDACRKVVEQVFMHPSVKKSSKRLSKKQVNG